VDVREVSVVTYSGDGVVHKTERVAMEEPLEVYIENEPFYTTMRLPGEEIPLALGLCFSDGLIASMDDIAGANYCSDVSANKINIYLSDAKKKQGPLAQKRRQLTIYSSCGVCGSDMIGDLTMSIPVIGKRTTVEFSRLFPMQMIMVEKQKAHHLTGGDPCGFHIRRTGWFPVFRRGRGAPQRPRQGHRKTSPRRKGPRGGHRPP